jgi:hypothetical protein
MKIKRFTKIFDSENYFKLIDIVYNCLNRLRFADNFQSVIYEDIYLAAGTEYTLANRMGIIPSHRIITKQDAYAQFQDGEWTSEHMKLTSDTNCTISVVYLL